MIPDMTEDEFNSLDTDGNNYLSMSELLVTLGGNCASTYLIDIKQENVVISCDDYDKAHEAIADAFRGIRATDICHGTDVTDSIRVIGVALIDRNSKVKKPDLDMIAEKIQEYSGKYEGTVANIREIFHNYFLFKPGRYTITYVIENARVTETQTSQVITIDDKCRGCLGCYSCDSCAGRRPIPDNVMELKQIIGDWLLVGLSMLVLVSLTGFTKKK